MHRHTFLAGLHERYTPRTYLEIGINDGRGLACSRTRTIGVDPEFKVRAELACDLQLIKATSDDFFARPDALAWFPESSVDLTFIDGMHIFEFALRDFINAERLSGPASVIAFDDMLPRSVDEAARDRHTVEWTGDVYKVAQVLERFRPDLVVVPVDTEPTGITLVVGLDPTSTTLSDNYDAILAEYATSDPQRVPDDVLHRKTAAAPEDALASPAWGQLASARSDGQLPSDVPAAIGRLRGTAKFVLVPPVPKPFPPPKKATAKKAPPAKKATAKKTAAKKAAKKSQSARQRAKRRSPINRLRNAVKIRL
jgi:hypothetical protein